MSEPTLALETMVIRFVTNVDDQFVSIVDGKTVLGLFTVGDIVTFQRVLARALVDQGAAVDITPTSESLETFRPANELVAKPEHVSLTDKDREPVDSVMDCSKADLYPDNEKLFKEPKIWKIVVNETTLETQTAIALDALKQCEANAEKKKLIPLLVFKRSRTETYAVLRWPDLLALIKRGVA